MPKKKRNVKKPETQVYMIDVSDWEVYYSFHGTERAKSHGLRRHGEEVSLTIHGDLTYPKYKTLSKARVYLTSEPEIDDHWRADFQGVTQSPVGFIQTCPDKIRLDVMASIPARLFTNLQTSLNASKLKIIQVYGERLKWGRGAVLWFSLSTKIEE